MAKLKHITVSQEVYQKLKDLGKAEESFCIRSKKKYKRNLLFAMIESQ